jgi:N-methylhydantoinase A/oxoprolinase/acetone carboxylase beta subunit
VLVNIDNGGTLTDVCLIHGDTISRTKVLTTPHDLSECLFDGLRQISQVVYGEPDLERLLREVEHIRYSTTQGTNALVQRQGPRLGLLLATGADLYQLSASSPQLFADLVGERHVQIDPDPDGPAFEEAVVAAVNALTAHGAERLVLVLPDTAAEAAVERVVLRRFPRQMLGAVPLLPSCRVTDDPDMARRMWTALLNAFLHPAMERFLYLAEQRLRISKARNPLLIFRNDGGASRVAKTMALKSYSSGPRGGMEGVAALARHYDFRHVISFDVGGTTTDLGMVVDGVVRSSDQGLVEGIATSLPLADIHSAGVGGSSIIAVCEGAITVGPLSVGSAPGPACFARGGTLPTVTDALLVAGLLDAETFLNGTLRLDTQRAASAIMAQIAEPLGLSLEVAVAATVDAWVKAIVVAIQNYGAIEPDTTLMAFGGGGPLLASRIAAGLGATRVFLPALSPVFSAYGIGFSDVSQSYRQHLPAATVDGFSSLADDLLERAERDMFGEGSALSNCELSFAVVADGKIHRLSPPYTLPPTLVGRDLKIEFTATRPTRRILLGELGKPAPVDISSSHIRALRLDGVPSHVPLHRTDTLLPGARLAGPLVLEDPFSTAFVDEGWLVDIQQTGDVLLERAT